MKPITISHLLTLVAPLLLLQGTTATRTGSTRATTTAAKSCQSYKIPVTVTSTNVKYGLKELENDFDVDDYVLNITSRTADFGTIINGTETVTASYTIGATFCAPTSATASSHKDTVLLLSHGLGFDRS